MVGAKPEHWRVLTPAVVVTNLVATMIVGYLPTHMVEGFEKHLDRIDAKFDVVATKQNDSERRLALLQGQCCRKSYMQSKDDQDSN